MHNGELAKKYHVSPAYNTKRMSSKTRCYVPLKLMFCTWMITLLHCGLVKFRSIRWLKIGMQEPRNKHLLDWLVTIVTTLQKWG